MFNYQIIFNMPASGIEPLIIDYKTISLPLTYTG